MNPQWLIGKTIARVDMRPFDASDGKSRKKRTAHNPVITFTDGSAIEFSTEETETGEYGTSINYRPKLYT
jgi:hypothetical protein